MKLIGDFPGIKKTPDEELDNQRADLIALVKAMDNETGTTTSSQEISSWIEEHVYDDNNNPDWHTSMVYSDDEIIDSVLGVNISSAVSDVVSDESSIDTPLDLSTSDKENLSPDLQFSKSLKCIEYLQNFLHNDAIEIGRLKALRTKLIEQEFKKRIL